MVLLRLPASDPGTRQKQSEGNIILQKPDDGDCSSCPPRSGSPAPAQPSQERLPASGPAQIFPLHFGVSMMKRESWGATLENLMSAPAASSASGV